MPNTDTTPRWKTKVELRRNEIAEILEALHEMRDHTGDPAGDLELRLTSLLHKGDRQFPAARAQS